MGDRYELNLHCVYCNEMNYNIWFAPTCGSYTFKCTNCNKINFIKNFVAIKIEDITIEDMYNEFLNATSVFWDEKELKRIKEYCKNILERLKKEK